tara:strand:- start:132 stop:704 length:573 start_codon:yes stop_codon:yes gene_type:complete
MGKRTDTKAIAESANAADRRYEMLEMTKRGGTVREIARTMDVHPSLVSREVRRALRELAEAHTDTADEVRALQMERYTSLFRKWYPLAMDMDDKATKIVLQIMSRINDINGIIPDKPLINISTGSAYLNPADFVFSMEAASGKQEEAKEIEVEVVEADPSRCNWELEDGESCPNEKGFSGDGFCYEHSGM